MNIIIDICNTCVKMVCFDGDNVVEEVRADKNESTCLLDFCSKYRFEKGIYSNVSDLDTEFCDAINSLPFPMLHFVSDETPIPIINRYATPKTLGTDRLAAAVGANYLRPDNDVLIIDIGTCVTFDMVSSKREYLGGNISPGLSMRLKALNAYTDRLPLVDRKGNMSLIGDTTETAIRNGVVNGVKYEIEGYINHFMKEYPELFVYLTGGVHLNLHFSEKMPIFADNFIVPKGLNRILEYNNGLL